MESDSISVQQALRALAERGKSVDSSKNAMIRANVEHQIELAAFIAIRDLAASYLQRSPYSVDVDWPVERVGGQYRFAHMAAGDAVVGALSEASEAQTADQLVDRLRAGGGFHGLRAVTAALRALDRVEALGDNRYRLKPVEVDPDDLPFE